MPVGHAPRTVIDIHNSTGSDFYSSLSDQAAYAKNYYDQMWRLIQHYLPNQAHKVVFGETGPVDNYGCSPYSFQWTDAFVNGNGASGGFVNSTLFQNDAANVVLRPWLSTAYENGWCSLYPNVLNAPYKIN